MLPARGAGHLSTWRNMAHTNEESPSTRNAGREVTGEDHARGLTPPRSDRFPWPQSSLAEYLPPHPDVVESFRCILCGAPRESSPPPIREVLGLCVPAGHWWAPPVSAASQKCEMLALTRLIARPGTTPRVPFRGPRSRRPRTAPPTPEGERFAAHTRSRAPSRRAPRTTTVSSGRSSDSRPAGSSCDRDVYSPGLGCGRLPGERLLRAVPRRQRQRGHRWNCLADLGLQRPGQPVVRVHLGR